MKIDETYFSGTETDDSIENSAVTVPESEEKYPYAFILAKPKKELEDSENLETCLKEAEMYSELLRDNVRLVKRVCQSISLTDGGSDIYKFFKIPFSIKEKPSLKLCWQCAKMFHMMTANIVEHKIGQQSGIFGVSVYFESVEPDMNLRLYMRRSSLDTIQGTIDNFFLTHALYNTFHADETYLDVNEAMDEVKIAENVRFEINKKMILCGNNNAFENYAMCGPFHVDRISPNIKYRTKGKPYHKVISKNIFKNSDYKQFRPTVLSQLDNQSPFETGSTESNMYILFKTDGVELVFIMDRETVWRGQEEITIYGTNIKGDRKTSVITDQATLKWICSLFIASGITADMLPGMHEKVKSQLVKNEPAIREQADWFFKGLEEQYNNKRKS